MRGCYLIMRKLQSKQIGKKFDSQMFRYHPAIKHGRPIGEALRLYEGYVVCFDYKTRNPKWVLEHLTRESVSGDADRAESGFYEDTVIDDKFRNKQSAFVGSGYDKGHMAPAANYKGSQRAMNETFSMSNISPQVGIGFNRHYWARLEKFVKDVAKLSDEVYVLTGPLWLPTNQSGKLVMQHDMLGEVPELVSVPTHFYKVILSENGTGSMNRSYSVGAFVLPNMPIEKEVPLSTFVVPVGALESAAGLRFFPKILDNLQLSALDSKAIMFRKQGLQQFKRLKSSKSLPLLTAPGVESVAKSQSMRSQSANDIIVKQGSFLERRVAGTQHLCEAVACALPSEDWWKAAKEEYERKEQLELEKALEQDSK
eukprot:TRINITY_DN14801_c0_g1_i3.p2 TRINITY_DN14801_c0_g1~~TRINITY_DN14801_c0_g1_i3.p2  ORF type:complete len:369 (-),score=43.16 TRINITY_DN14801_c0_g1_i3:565-1671(-)